MLQACQGYEDAAISNIAGSICGTKEQGLHFCVQARMVMMSLRPQQQQQPSSSGSSSGGPHSEASSALHLTAQAMPAVLCPAVSLPGPLDEQE